jgi:hypothetical protein
MAFEVRVDSSVSRLYRVRLLVLTDWPNVKVT